MIDLTETEFQKQFISAMRAKLQSINGRESLLYLMMEEIRLDLMQRTQKPISRTEAIEHLQEEFNDVATLMRQKDIAEVFGTLRNA